MCGIWATSSNLGLQGLPGPITYIPLPFDAGALSMSTFMAWWPDNTQFMTAAQ